MSAAPPPEGANSLSEGRRAAPVSAKRFAGRSDSIAARSLRALHALPRRGLVALVLAYRFALKPWLGNACRFEPSCSAYALEALQRHGAMAGAALGAARLLRCHPWCEGGHDPVPQQAPRLFTRLLAKTRP